MDHFIASYIERMDSYSDVISESIDSMKEYWAPDEPPIIMLSSHIGKALVKAFPKLDRTERELIFEHIENGMISANDELATAVATGLIEAMVTSTDDNQCLWEEVEKALRQKSKEHALAWKIFGQ